MRMELRNQSSVCRRIPSKAMTLVARHLLISPAGACRGAEDFG
jgi:hypothetical protein